jgi:hypothetical protein
MNSNDRETILAESFVIVVDKILNLFTNSPPSVLKGWTGIKLFLKCSPLDITVIKNLSKTFLSDSRPRFSTPNSRQTESYSTSPLKSQQPLKESSTMVGESPPKIKPPYEYTPRVKSVTAVKKPVGEKTQRLLDIIDQKVKLATKQKGNESNKINEYNTAQNNVENRDFSLKGDNIIEMNELISTNISEYGSNNKILTSTSNDIDEKFQKSEGIFNYTEKSETDNRSSDPLSCFIGTVTDQYKNRKPLVQPRHVKYNSSDFTNPLRIIQSNSHESTPNKEQFSIQKNIDLQVR